ncbi:MAG: LysR family transcriptional regulator [Lachnospiraceae bacterium]|nr:LysR family transcriptional regulator [Lachnospiraceae bacterium]
MEIQQLIYLNAVVNYKSYTKAAASLHVSQPTISMALRKLETELGIQLFEEDIKPLRLTPIGEKILERGTNILIEHQNILSESADLSTQSTVSIRLGIPFTLYNDLPFLLNTEFLPKHTNIKLRLFQYGVEIITEKLQLGNLDVGLICKASSSGFHSAEMNPLEFHAFFSPDHPLAQYSIITPNMLTNETLILSELESNDIEKNISDYLSRYDIAHVRSSHGMLIPHTSILLAEMNMGIAFLEKNFSSQKYKTLHAPLDPPLTLQMVVAWNKRKYISKAQKDLIHYLQKLRL